MLKAASADNFREQEFKTPSHQEAPIQMRFQKFENVPSASCLLPPAFFKFNLKSPMTLTVTVNRKYD